jgi:hypothetical protein
VFVWFFRRKQSVIDIVLFVLSIGLDWIAVID